MTKSTSIAAVVLSCVLIVGHAKAASSTLAKTSGTAVSVTGPALMQVASKKPARALEDVKTVGKNNKVGPDKKRFRPFRWPRFKDRLKPTPTVIYPK